MINFFKKFLRNKRAVTPVLSELLLTIIAVAAMSVATTATYAITTNLRENMSERIVIEDMWFRNQTGTLDIYLFNIGKADITVSALYIDHQSQLLVQPFQLMVGTHQVLHISYGWNSGSIYYIDLVTDRGTHIASEYKAT